MTIPPAWQERGASLLTRCRTGEESAWEEVYHLVLVTCRQPRWRLGDAAQDVASTVVLSLIEGGLEKVREPQAFLAFLRRAAVNAAIDWLRSRREVSLEPSGDDERPVEREAPDPSPLQDAMGREVTMQVLEAIRRLGEPCHSLLDAYLAFRVGLVGSYRELEEILGRKANVISVQVRRCLERLREDPAVVALADTGHWGND